MTARRTSARLSGEAPSSSTLSAYVEPRITRKRRSGETAEAEAGTNGSSAAATDLAVELVDVSRKKAKVATIKMKPAARGRKPAFQPAPLPRPSAPDLTQPIDDTFQPPPPPRTPKPARHRPSLRGAPEPDEHDEAEEGAPSAEPESVLGRRAPVRVGARGGNKAAPAPAAARTASNTKQASGKASDVQARSRSRNDGAQSGGEARGLGAGTSLDAELGDERGRWKPGGVASGHRAADDDLDRHLDFLNTAQATSQPIYTAPRPRTPPPVLGLIAPQTPGQPSRRILPRKSFAGSHNPMLGTPGRGGDISKDVMVPLAIVDTPLVNRERQSMRRDASRRSSTGRTGQRMSESLTRGEVSMPHASVLSDKLWRSLNPSLPEPKRAQNLNLWTLARADLKPATELPLVQASGTLEALTKKGGGAQGKAKGKTKESGPPVSDRTAELARKVMERLMDDVKTTRIQMNTFPPPGIIPDFGGLRPHPRNVMNRERETKLSAIMEQDKIESSLWSKEITMANKRIEDFRNLMNRPPDVWTENDPIPGFEAEETRSQANGLLSGQAVENARMWSRLAGEVLAEVEDRSLERDDGDAEYKVDLLGQACHQTVQFSNQASRFLDGIFSSLAQDLRNRQHLDGSSSSGVPILGGDAGDPSNPNMEAVSLMSAVHRASAQTGTTSASAPSASSAAKSDPIEMLKALARAESSTQSQEILVTAASLPPVLPLGSTGSGSGAASTLVPPTPRRGLGGSMTPRRSGVLGGSTPKR